MALITLLVGAFLGIGGKWIEIMAPLYAISWFSGFIVSFGMYYFLMKKILFLTISLIRDLNQL